MGEGLAVHPVSLTLAVAERQKRDAQSARRSASPMSALGRKADVADRAIARSRFGAIAEVLTVR